MSASINNPASLAAQGWKALPESYRIPDTAPSLAEARMYCERLAKSHYENFSVATWFLPAKLRQHFYNVYSYCRISDDLGDEVGNAQQSLELLDQWEAELNACYAGSPRHPVFVALAETVKQFGIPQHEFSDLLIAFRRDQTITRFETFNDILEYCKYSANPVGHLVLYLGGYMMLSARSFLITHVQRCNWPTSGRTLRSIILKGRIYLPLEDLRRFGVSEQDIAGRKATQQFIDLMKFEVQRAREWFDRGFPLINVVNKELAMDLELFSRGGQEILNAIEAQGFDVLRQRPVISKPRKLWLVARAAVGKIL